MDEPFIGQISMFGFNYPPVHWAACHGQLIAITENPALYSLISDFYGGDSRTVMRLPDFRGRVALGYGQGPGLSPYQIGDRNGVEAHAMSLDEMPVHNHAAVFESSGGTVAATVMVNCVTGSSSQTNNPEGAYWAEAPSATPAQAECYDTGPPDSVMAPDAVTVDISGIIGGTVAVQNNGSSEPFDIIQPYQAINYCIALEGIYPSRN